MLIPKLMMTLRFEKFYLQEIYQNKLLKENQLMVQKLIHRTFQYHPFKLLISSTCIDPLFLKNTTKIAKPIAASAAATVRTNIVNT